MAEKTKTVAARTRGSALDVPMAAFAGGALGFFAFAMPADLFEGLVRATGLPGVIGAAQPPLGNTARLAFVAAAATAMFAAVWLLLRRLGKAATPTTTLAEELQVQSEPPRLRRADKHPDAPSRHPLRAGSDFGVPLDAAPNDDRGEPVDVSVVENVDFEAEWERPAPSFLQARTSQVEAEDEELLLSDDEDGTFDDEEIAEEPGETYDAKYDPAPTDIPFWVPEGAQETAEDEPAPEIEQNEADAATNAHAILPFWAQHSQAETGEEAVDSPEPSLDQLSNRLEGGLIRRKRDGRPTRPRGTRGTDDRLRTALDDLTKMKSRR